MAEHQFIRLRFETKKPIELNDFSEAMFSIAQQYKTFMQSYVGPEAADTSALYVQSLKDGSIIADLASIAEQISFVADQREVIAAFFSSIVDLANFFLHYQKPSEGSGPSSSDARRISNFFEPIAKEGGSQVIIQVNGNINIQSSFNSIEASTIQNNVRRYASRALPSSSSFSSEPLSLFQVRGDAKTHAGDRGIIQKYSERSVRLYFMSEDAKRAILDQPENPFQMIFIVDGEVGYSGDDPVVYKISRVVESFEK